MRNGVLTDYAGDRENLLTYSEQFDNGDWSKGDLTVSANDTTAPDGSETADKLVEGSSDTTHQAYQAFTVVKGEWYFLSAYIKAVERTTIRIKLGDAADFSTSTDVGNFDLSAGTGAGDASYLGIENVGNGWYRCWIASQCIASGTAVAYFVVGEVSYQGDGTSGLYIWGAQLEKLEGPVQGSAVELVTNGDFGAALGAEWVGTDAESTLSIESGELKVLNTDGTSSGAKQPGLALVEGQWYHVSIDLDISTGSSTEGKVQIGSGPYSTEHTHTADGTYTFQFVADSNDTTIQLRTDGVDTHYTLWDNISIKDITQPGPLSPSTYTQTVASTVAIPAEAPFGSDGLYNAPETTNHALYNRDFSDATWTKSNVTPSTATDLSGNTTTIRLTADANDGTVLQTVTLASAEHTTSCYLKRVTGTGAVYTTDDNSNWTERTLTSEWQRFDFQRTQADPVIGIKFAASGDAVDCDLFQVEEDQAFATAPIPTADLPITRTAPSQELQYTMSADAKALFSVDEGWDTSVDDETDVTEYFNSFADSQSWFDPREYGSDLLSGWDFTSGWTVSNATVNDSDTFTITVNAGYIYKSSTIVTPGEIYRCRIAGIAAAGITKFWVYELSGSVHKTDMTGTFDETFTFISDGTGQIGLRGNGTGQIDITTLEIKQILSPASEYAASGTATHAVIIRDSSGVLGHGFIGEAGSGETLGSDIARSFSQVTGSGATITGSQIDLVDEIASIKDSSYWTTGTLHKVNATISSYSGSGGITLPYDGSNGVDIHGASLVKSVNGTYEYYYMPDDLGVGDIDSMYIYSTAGHTATVVINWIKEVTAPPSSAATIYKDLSLTAEGWVLESGFDVNDVSTFDIMLTDECSAEGSLVCEWMPHTTYDGSGADSGILNINNSAISLFYAGYISGNLKTKDGSITVSVDPDFAANTDYKIALRWGYLTSGVPQFQIGESHAGSWTWGTEQDFDGRFTSDGILRFFYSNDYPSSINNIHILNEIIDKQEN